MVVVDHMPKRYKGIDMITTPAGDPVALVQCNNCSTDINGWAGLFKEFADCLGVERDMGEIYTLLFEKALQGEKDCGGLLSYNYFSGEGVTGVNSGVPVFMRTPDSHLSLASFMRTHINSTFATLRIGLDLLRDEENIKIDGLLAHGGLFKTKGVAQTLLSAAAKCEVSVASTASEGGPYGMALLAAYLIDKKDETLAEYLDKIFSKVSVTCLMAEKEDIDGFDSFMERYKKSFGVEKTAIDTML
jgi:sugar (pentulose or hexulose) kinase